MHISIFFSSSKVGYVLPIVFWFAIRMGKYRDDDNHREDAPHFSSNKALNLRSEFRDKAHQKTERCGSIKFKTKRQLLCFWFNIFGPSTFYFLEWILLAVHFSTVHF